MRPILISLHQQSDFCCAMTRCTLLHSIDGRRILGNRTGSLQLQNMEE